ncbi:MAG: hypothetical protein JWO72_1787 [Caulobacteraceae bacterium]|nr:hypothetical protein [Caulobacteraceae bacterium]
MSGEFDIGGVFVPALLVWGLAAVAISLPVRWLLARTGVYRLVWHRGLFDIALVVLLWGAIAVCAASPALAP